MEDPKPSDGGNAPKMDSAKQAELAFKLYDKDKDGYITKSEMEKLSKTLSKEQIEKVTSKKVNFFSSPLVKRNFKVFARFDADGDGRLSWSEFRKMMNK